MKTQFLPVLCCLFLLSAVHAQSTVVPITDWEISQVFDASNINVSQIGYPRFYTIFLAGWHRTNSQPSGWMDLTRVTDRTGSNPSLILARTIFSSEAAGALPFSFAYAGETAVFMNGIKQFYGNRPYEDDDTSSTGMDVREKLYLEINKGLNEVFLMVKSTNDGWGFEGRTDRELSAPARAHGRTNQLWETPQDFLTSESVLYDSQRDVLYVTSFDNSYDASNTDENKFTGFISRVNLEGEIEDLHWVTHLNAPCGMGISGNKLYTVERGFLTEIDIESGSILQRYPVPGSDFLNDLAIDNNGNIYLSDTRPSSHSDSRIYRFKEGIFEVWEDGPEISRANGLFVHGDRLLVGNTGDGCLKSVHLNTKKIETITCLGAGVVDGIRVTGDGNYLVSHWEGQVYTVTPDGQVTEVIDLQHEGCNTADFEFIKEKKLFVIPTFVANSVVAFQFE